MDAKIIHSSHTLAMMQGRDKPLIDLTKEESKMFPYLTDAVNEENLATLVDISTNATTNATTDYTTLDQIQEQELEKGEFFLNSIGRNLVNHKYEIVFNPGVNEWQLVKNKNEILASDSDRCFVIDRYMSIVENEKSVSGENRSFASRGRKDDKKFRMSYKDREKAANGKISKDTRVYNNSKLRSKSKVK